jgi:TonB family protein
VAGAAASVGLHAAAIVAVLLILSPLAPPPAPVSFTIAFERPAAVPLATIGADRLSASKADAPTELARAVPGRIVHATELSEHTRARPAAPSVSAAPSPVAAPAAHAAPSPADVAGLKLHIRDAVRAATLYPAVARQMHREGRAQVAFAYVDGAVRDIALIQSSRSNLLDEAALAAVRRATYPRPPAGLEGVRLALEVWVNFGLEP